MSNSRIASFRPVAFASVAFLVLLSLPTRGGTIALPPEGHQGMDAIYGGDPDGAIAIARGIQKTQPDHPFGYLLEAEALWWKRYCAACEIRYGIIEAWKRSKEPEDQAYLTVADREIDAAEGRLAKSETAEMHVYAGMGYALKARVYALRSENRSVARVAVKGRAEMLRALDADSRVARVDFIPSEASLRVFAEEMQLSGRNGLMEKLLGTAASGKIIQHTEADIGASVASGSYRSHGMVVLPCSMGTLAGIANGMASNLIERAADVCLKERRPLILCVRESPFNRIHLRNMQLASDAGATIFPVMPTLYNRPQSTAEMARQFVDRVLAHVGLPQPGAYEWKGD